MTATSRRRRAEPEAFLGPYINSCGARSRRPTSRGRQRGWRPGGRRTSVECLLHSRLAGEERHVTGAAATRVECTRDAMRVPGGQALAARGCWLSGGHLDGGAERGVPALRRAHHHPPRPQPRLHPAPSRRRHGRLLVTCAPAAAASDARSARAPGPAAQAMRSRYLVRCGPAGHAHAVHGAPRHGSSSSCRMPVSEMHLQDGSVTLGDARHVIKWWARS